MVRCSCPINRHETISYFDIEWRELHTHVITHAVYCSLGAVVDAHVWPVEALYAGHTGLIDDSACSLSVHES